MITFGVIGATGSVGSSALRLARLFPEGCRVAFVAARQPSSQLKNLADEFNCPAHAATSSPQWTGLTGQQTLLDLCLASDLDSVIFAASGVETAPLLLPVLEAGKEVLLANKETALLLGPILATYVERGQLRPLDSEHNALWQCLFGERRDRIAKLWLTASGGPFLRRDLKTLHQVTAQEALAHPVWSMGPKITIDSATMVNKGIEVLEASVLFGQPLEKIEAVVCPGSSVHGAVEFYDGTIKLCACPPDMTLAAQAALFGTSRPNYALEQPALDLTHLSLHFEPIDTERFPAYRLARTAGQKGRRAVLAFLGADQAAVEAFLAGQINWSELHHLLEKAVNDAPQGDPRTLEEGLEVINAWAIRTKEILC